MTEPSTEAYQFNAAHGVYVPSAWAVDLTPPAPDTPEGRLLAILQSEADLSHGSEGLLKSISDEFTRLHLSPERANFLQPFRELLRGHALATGSAIGPVARFLAECGADVHAVEPDFVQAALAAARCRDLSNVRVYAADPACRFPDATPCDVIVATAPADPSVRIESCIDGFRRALAPGGLLIVAVNNSLGMSSLVDDAGHRVTSDSGWQLGKAAVDEVFAAAGFEHVTLYCAFPSYDCSRLMVDPYWSAGLPDGLETMLSAYDRNSPARAGEPDRSALWKAVLQNGLLAHLSNSFVIAASLQPQASTCGNGRLLVQSALRRKHFAKATIFSEERGELAVFRRPLFPDAAPPPDSLLRRRTYDEPYFEGTPYLAGLQQILNREEWRPEEIADWCKPWLDLLDAQASDETFRGYIGLQARLRVLPPIYADCIPDNIRVGKNGELLPTDFEYEAVAPIPLKFVIFRGLHHALSAVPAASSTDPAFGNIAGLVLEVMRLAGVPLNEGELSNYISIEATLQDNVTAAAIPETEVGLRSARLRIIPASSASPASSAAAADVVQLFWKTKDAKYDESASACAAVYPGQDQQVIAIVIPPIVPPPDTLRLDPCTQPGVFYLSSLRLFNAPGDCIWAWDGDRASFIEKRSLSFADTLFDSGAIVYSEGDDPSLELPARPEVLRGLEAGGRLEVVMSWPEMPDYLMIGRRILDGSGYRERIRSLEAEMRALVRSRDTEAELHAEILGRHDSVAAELAVAQRQNAECLETQQRLTAELSEFNGELTRLRRECRALREENDRLNAEAAELERVQGQNDEFAEEQRRLMSELSRQKSEFASLKRALGIVRQDNERLAAEAGQPCSDMDHVLASANSLNRELQEQVRIMKEELTNVSSERYLLQRENRILAAEINRIDELERRLTDMSQSRIWCTLVALSSPFGALLTKRKK
jgi:hypothetical protein